MADTDRMGAMGAMHSSISADVRPAQPAPAAASAAQHTQQQHKWYHIAHWSSKRMIRTLRAINLLNSVFLAFVGALCLMTGIVAFSVATATIAAFMFMFAVLLCCAEINIANLQPLLQRQFGFLFSFVGRTLFLLFSGTMCFALSSWLGDLAGVLTILNAVWNGYVLYSHPAFKSGALSRGANPYSVYASGDAEAAAFLRANPQLAAKATAGVAVFAASNPQLASAAMQGAVGGAGSGTGAPGGARAMSDPFDFPSPTKTERQDLASGPAHVAPSAPPPFDPSADVDPFGLADTPVQPAAATTPAEDAAVKNSDDGEEPLFAL